MTSDRTISQVRAILSKLDRSIDEAREKRRQVPGAGASAPTSHFAPPPAAAPVAAPTPGPAAAAPKPPAPSTSAFGRAQPLRSSTPTNLIRFNTH